MTEIPNERDSYIPAEYKLQRRRLTEKFILTRNLFSFKCTRRESYRDPRESYLSYYILAHD